MEEEEEQDLKEATRVDDETMDNITILVCNRLSASCASLDSFALSRYYVCVCVCVCSRMTFPTILFSDLFLVKNSPTFFHTKDSVYF